MPTHDLAIYCNPTRLPWLDDSDSFGLAIFVSASWVGEKPDETQLPDLRSGLRLWRRLGDPLNVWLAVRDGEPTWESVDTADFDVTPWPTADDASRERLWDLADRRIDAIGGDRLIVQDDEIEIEKDGGQAAQDESDLHVRHILASLATQPAPVPGLLRLATTLRVKRSAWKSGQKLAVVPFVPGREPILPTTDETPLPVALEEGGTAKIVVYTLPLQRQIPQLDRDWLRHDGWVAPPDHERRWSDGDFVREVRRRWPGFCDEARQLVLEGQRQLRHGTLDGDDENRRATRMALRDAVIALSRDRAGYGLRVGDENDEDDLADRVGRLADWQEEEVSFLRAWLRAKERSDESPVKITLETWIDHLRRHVPAAERLSILAQPPESSDSSPPLQAKDLIRELGALLGALREPAVIGL